MVGRITIALMVFWYLLLFLPPSVRAADISNVNVLSCYDGDTCRVNLPRSAMSEVSLLEKGGTLLRGEIFSDCGEAYRR